MINNHIREELIIDYLLGNINDVRKNHIAAHLQTCSYCQSLLKSWDVILKTERNEQPSLKLKERLNDSLLKSDRQRKTKKWPIPIMTALGTAALILIIFQWLTQPEQPDYSPTIVQMNEQDNAPIMNDPMTQYVPIIPVADFQEVNGNVWVNYLSDELLVELFHLPVVSNRDYQLWIIYNNNQFTGEIITINNGTTRILLKDGDIQRLKRIKATLEPLGGSSKPTGPEPFIIEMKMDGRSQ